MTAGAYSQREPGSLKEAVSALVTACGGLDAAAAILEGRVRRSQLARYTSETEEYEFTHMPVDIARTLERVAGMPIVTRYLASAAGALVVSLPKAEVARKSHLERLGEISANHGDFFRTAMGALADGVLTPSEAAEMKARALEIAAGLGVFVGEMNRVIDSGAAEKC